MLTPRWAVSLELPALIIEEMVEQPKRDAIRTIWTNPKDY